MPYDPQILNQYGISWFATIRPAGSILWLGWSGVAYPGSHEVQALQSDPSEQGPVPFKRAAEAERIKKRYHMNPLYWRTELTLQWLDINPFK